MSRALPPLLVFALFASPLQGQPAPARGASRQVLPIPTEPDAALDRAFALLDSNRPGRAGALFGNLTKRADLTGRQRSRALRGLGLASLARGQRSEAAELFARALDEALAAADRGEAGWARRWAGTVHYEAGRPEEAQALWDVALDDFKAAGDAYGEFEVLDDMAVKTPGLDRRPYSERCLAIAREQHDALLEARARSRWSHGLLDAGLPGPALIELEWAVATMRPFGRRADPHLGDALALLGWALRAHGAHDRAVPVHREAIRLAKLSGDVESQIWNYMGLGAALAELGHGAQAEAAMRLGLRAAERTGAPTSIRLMSQSLGWVALKRGRWQTAVNLLEAAQAMPGTQTVVTPLIHLSQAYRELNRLDDAADRAGRAVAVARKLGLVDNELRALVETAQVAARRNHLDEAERTLRDVVDRLETYRASLAHVDYLKQGFGDRFNDAYGLLVNLLMRQGKAGDALAAAERVRSRAFADLLAARRVRETEDAQAGRWLLGGPNTPSDATPETADSPLTVRALDEAGLARLARRLETPLVVYWIHPNGSYAWVVAPTGVIHATRLRTSPAHLRRAVGLAVDTVPDLELMRPASGSATASVPGRDAYRALYRVLWEPLERWLPTRVGARITVIPYGPLFQLPFAALVDGRGRYLLEQYALHYGASGAVLAEAARRVRGVPTPEDRVLLVADPRPVPAPESGTVLPALPAARAEVRSIAPLFASRVDMLVGAQASEQAVRSALPAAAVAHFATHALVRDADPLGSHLVLATMPGVQKADDNARLTAGEIAGLSLSSDLVVLGACRSAAGSVSSDGIAGLTRAFMAAGAASVVATLWEVPDEPTSRVMKAFYRAYLAGTPKDQALRQAQLRLLRELRAGHVVANLGGRTVAYPEHPYLWAGTILVGAP